MLWDTHMHCRFSGDSDAEPEDMILASISRGLDGICFTDHLDLDYPNEPDAFLLDYPAYHNTIYALRDKYAGRFHINWGIEMGLQPHVASMNAQIAKSYPFDFVIGSSHVVHGIDPYYPRFYEGRREEDGYLEYFESILENIACYQDFDVYGHIDYVVRYGPNKNKNYSYKKFADVIDEILRQLVARGKGIEINTAGFKYGLGHPNPTEEIIKRYHELGGEIITIGADAHKPEHVAYDFAKVPDLLKASGFQYYTVFTNRKPQFFQLP